MLARSAASEQQNRKIGTPDPEHQSDGGEKEVESVNEGEVVLVGEALEVNPKVFWEGTRGLFRENLKKRLEVGLGGLRADTGLESNAGEPEQCARVVGDLQRKVDVGHGPCEARRQDPDYCVVPVGHRESLAYHLGIAGKAALPERKAQDDDRLRILPLGCIGG